MKKEDIPAEAPEKNREDAHGESPLGALRERLLFEARMNRLLRDRYAMLHSGFREDESTDKESTR